MEQGRLFVRNFHIRRLAEAGMEPKDIITEIRSKCFDLNIPPFQAKRLTVWVVYRVSRETKTPKTPKISLGKTL